MGVTRAFAGKQRCPLRPAVKPPGIRHRRGPAPSFGKRRPRLIDRAVGLISSAALGVRPADRWLP